VRQTFNTPRSRVDLTSHLRVSPTKNVAKILRVGAARAKKYFPYTWNDCL